MPRQTLNKSINAKKLHTRTMNALPEQETYIPFGAVIDNVKLERDRVTFSYLSEPYGCPRDVYQSATSGAKEEQPAATHRAEPEPAKLQFEELSSTVEGLLRAKVPGGWLIATEQGGVTFYPDAAHSWDGESSE